MTCIISLIQDDVLYIAGDSCVSFDNEKQVMSNRKVFHVGDLLIASSGLARQGNILQFMATPTKQESDDPLRYMVKVIAPHMYNRLHEAKMLIEDEGRERMSGALLIGYRAKLYKIDTGFGVHQFATPFQALGVGSEYALGALAFASDALRKAGYTKFNNPTEVLTDTLAMVAHYVNGVSGPYYVEEQKMSDRSAE